MSDAVERVPTWGVPTGEFKFEKRPAGGRLAGMKWFISCLAALGAVWLTGCGEVSSQNSTPMATTSGATEIVHVDPAGAAALLKEGKIAVLDVRTPREFASAHIKGARLIDFKASDFRDQLARLDRDQTYLVHCAVGGRSTSALAVFQELGFKKVVHLDGGMKAWEKAGEPVER